MSVSCIENIEWRKIPGYEGLYEVSNDGRVRSWKNGSWGRAGKPKELSQNITETGYPMLSLCRDGVPRKVTVHRLVTEAFISNPENKPCINHLDGDRANNHVNNLEWCTYAENNQHAYDTGAADRRGEGQPRSILTEREVIEIREKYVPRVVTQADLAKEYNVSRSAICSIVNRHCWTHLD